MSLGMILLVAVTVLVLFGVMQRVLDRLRMTDRQALLLVAAIFIGGLLPDIQVTPVFSLNIGGALIPLGICVYLWIKADGWWERIRSLLAAVLAGGAVYALSYFLPAEPREMMIDPNALYGPVAGVIAWVFGRSRRAAFIAGIVGVLLADTAAAPSMPSCWRVCWPSSCAKRWASSSSGLRAGTSAARWSTRAASSCRSAAAMKEAMGHEKSACMLPVGVPAAGHPCAGQGR